MSFRCENCKVASEGSPIVRVTERREKEYKSGDRASRGHEIVKEKKICGICAVEIKDAPIPFGLFEVESAS